MPEQITLSLLLYEWNICISPSAMSSVSLNRLAVKEKIFTIDLKCKPVSCSGFYHGLRVSGKLCIRGEGHMDDGHS